MIHSLVSLPKESFVMIMSPCGRKMTKWWLFQLSQLCVFSNFISYFFIWLKTSVWYLNFYRVKVIFCSFSSWISSLPPPNLKHQVISWEILKEKNDKRNFLAPVQSEPIEDIEIIPENEVPKGSPPVDLSAEFAELNQESGNVMAEGELYIKHPVNRF